MRCGWRLSMGRTRVAVGGGGKGCSGAAVAKPPEGAISLIAANIGCRAETLRRWALQAERDQGLRGGPATAEQERLRALERDVRALLPGPTSSRAAQQRIVPKVSSAPSASLSNDPSDRRNLALRFAPSSDDRLDRQAPGGSRGRADRARSCRSPPVAFRLLRRRNLGPFRPEVTHEISAETWRRLGPAAVCFVADQVKASFPEEGARRWHGSDCQTFWATLKSLAVAARRSAG